MKEIQGRMYEVVTLDFETYYDADYTLSGRKLNTSEYVRDERFKVHVVGIKVGDKKTVTASGDENIRKLIHSIDWPNSALLCHNTAFDGFILKEHYDVVPGFYLDTLCMARATHGHHTRLDLDTLAKLHGLKGKVKRAALADTKGKSVLTEAELKALRGYCADDVNDTCKIYWKLDPSVPDAEQELIDLTIRMFCDPVLEVDTDRAQAELEREIGGKVSAKLLAGVTSEQLLSNSKFADLLYKQGISPPIKISPTTGKTTYAFAKTDQGFQNLLTHANENICNLAKARLKLKSTIGETRAVRLIEAGKDGKKLPVLLNYSGAHTHRWSGGNKLNLQNLKRGGELRRSIKAPDGMAIVVADSAQIEARVLAWLAGQDNLVQAFSQKRDVYKMLAANVYRKEEDEVTKNERFLGKVCVLGLGYGMSSAKLQTTLHQGIMGPPVEISMLEASRLVHQYRYTNERIVDLWRRMNVVIYDMTNSGTNYDFGPLRVLKNAIQLPSGLFLQYPALECEARVDKKLGEYAATEATYLTRSGKNKIYGGLLTENVVQALAREVVAYQMLEISRKYRVATMTHDEIVCVVPENEAKEALDHMINVMSTAPEWADGLPLSAEGGYDKVYSK
jgi:DNA polymerase